LKDVIAEIIDDEINKNILVCEHSHNFSDTFSARGLNVFKSELSDSFSHLNNEVDSVFISLNLFSENANHILRISEVLLNFSNLNKVYILICSDKSDNKIHTSLVLAIKLKFLENRIKLFFRSKLQFSKNETQHILKNNGKIQQILPRYLFKDFYRRSWRVKSGSYLRSFLKWLKFFLVKFSFMHASNDILMVFENEK
tara:strand:- start:13636 stop:14229 length:594 start_codon:yes stop_codon:yes gene_type:complete